MEEEKLAQAGSVVKEVLREFEEWNLRYLKDLNSQIPDSEELARARSFALRQVMHPAFLRQVVGWDKKSPKEIAEALWEVAPRELEDWYRDEIDTFWLEENLRVRRILVVAKRFFQGKGKE